MVNTALTKLIKNKNLTEDEMATAMREIMEGKVPPSIIGSFLTALRMKGETIDEITGAAKIMREEVEQVDLSGLDTLDTCGTGGDHAGTFNISTAVAFVSAAAGIYVVKHGNRSVSSKSGSADVLEALGVAIDLSPKQVEKSVKEQHLGFFFAPTFHLAMKNLVAPRKELGFRTIFNILGPLTNPTKTKTQLVGVYDESLTESLANVLKNLGSQHALVVHGLDGIDEISISDKTKVSELKDNQIKTYYISPEDFGLKRSQRKEILGGDAKENAEIMKNLFHGEKGAKRDILLMNSGATLYVSKKANSIKHGITIAEELIDSGKVLKKMNEYIDYTRRLT